MAVRTRTRIGAYLACAALLGSAGCGASAGPRSVAWRTAAEDSAGPLGQSSSPSAGSDVTLAFAGDVHFAGRVGDLLERDPTTALGPIREVLTAADLAMVNLETAVTTRGTPEPKEFRFRTNPTAFSTLRAAGVDVATVANNHALDYGQSGLADTLSAARSASIPLVGAGANADAAYAPWVTEIRGTRIAVIAVSQVHELESRWSAGPTRPGIAMAADGARAAAAVGAAREHADVVVAYVHWGQEGSACPTREQRTLAQQLANAGAALIVGTHAHLLQGGGWLGQTYVGYGLGNFLWWRDDAFSNDTGVLNVTIRNRKVSRAELLPAEISRTNGQPIPTSGAESSRIRNKFDGLRQCTGLSPDPA